ncbi:hypothetical protein [Sandaracinus amylolyticus]|uniref:Lipoprotein n=1 Tax=Sandaracinus amylolyticus TaxID=927083 RepID=A0A0F6YFV9_9BACT|nr:hypothetical protein [Sandaracinus amylolyticus]AKF04095.1 hypothetical protein DB32_001244 [Sandaracinus amylolyticus]
MSSSPALRFSSLALLAALVVGCSFDELDGDWSRGERGRTRWQIDDGLCPGFAGGCALDVPLAVGARTRIHVTGVDGDTVFAEAEGSVQLELYDVLSSDPAEPFFEIAAMHAGTGTLRLRDRVTGDEIDRIRVEVREATELDCGALATGVDVMWDVPQLAPSDPIELLMPGIVSSEPDAQLVCRARDERGPLLSADAIRWEVIEGADVIRLRTDGLFSFPPVEGARIRYDALARGEARIRVTLGEISRDLGVVVR